MESVGLISLGLQVCQGLVRYYESWKHCPRDVTATLESLSGLEKTFDAFDSAIKNPTLSQDVVSLVKQRIDTCWDGVTKLKKRLDKFGTAPDGSHSKISNVIQRSLYPFRESTLAKMREIVRDLRDNLDLALSASQFNMHIKSVNTLENISKQINTMSLAQTDDNRMKILDWVSPADDGAQHSDYISARGSGTGQSVLDSSEFKEWLHGSHLTLYCKGIPGSGKTMMTAIVIDHLLKQYLSRSTGIAFLYCHYRKHETQKASNLLASLLRQFSANRLSLPESVTALYEQHFPRGTRPSLEEISKSLHSVVETYSQVIIIIDALDECRNDDGTRSLILSENRKLQSHFKTKLMATSRDIPEVTQEFHGDMKLEVRASFSDLNCYLDEQITYLSKCIQRNEELKQKIKCDIIESAQDMFLLAKLHVESLQDKRTEKLIDKALQTLPKGSRALNESYRGVIERIDCQLPEDRKIAKKVVSWITYARRPLTTRELQHAVAVEPKTTELDTANLGDVDDMISVCAGLVTIDRESNVVRLVHYTAQQFFEDVGTTWIPDATEMIASTCLTYLAYDTFKGKPYKTDREIKAELSGSALLDYSTRYWGLHVSKIQNQMKDQILSFLQDRPLLRFWSRLMTRDDDWYHEFASARPSSEVINSGQIHVASRFDLDVIMEILSKEKDVDYTTRRFFRTPFSWAARWGSEKVVKLFLTREDINPNSTDYGDATPLSFAARYGQETIVRLLIAHVDVEIDWKDEEGRTPVSLAARNGHETVVKLLMEGKEVDVNSKDNYARTPCSYAAEAGHEAIIRLLMKREVDINHEDSNKRTPLSYAAKNGHESIVKLLLTRKDVEADSKDVWDCTPLTYAAKHRHENIVDILASRDDVNADSQDRDYRTPLSWAAICGYGNIVKFLIARDDVDADIQDRDFRTPLSWAAMYGYEDIVKSLIARDDVNADFRDRDCRTPLSWAAMYGYEAIVKSLIARDDVETDFKDSKGLSPLTYAAMYDHGAIVEILIARDDVDADSKDHNGRTPLSWAAGKGRETIVKFLIARDDVDADSKDRNDRTPLSYAAGHDRETIVKFLIARDDVDADSKDENGRTPLSWAAGNGCETVVKFLTARDDVDADSRDQDGQTPLSWAAGNHWETVVKFLIARKNVEVNPKDNNGESSLLHEHD